MTELNFSSWREHVTDNRKALQREGTHRDSGVDAAARVDSWVVGDQPELRVNVV
jgi:hypothetical protein